MIVHISRGEPYFRTEHGEEQARTWVRVRPPGSVDPCRFEMVEAILDTGSHWSYLPVYAAEGCPEEKPQQAAGLFGPPEPHRVVRVDLTLFCEAVSNVPVLLAEKGPLAESGLGLIGRDLLSRFVITFDGPAKRWDVVP